MTHCLKVTSVEVHGLRDLHQNAGPGVLLIGTLFVTRCSAYVTRLGVTSFSWPMGAQDRTGSLGNQLQGLQDLQLLPTASYVTGLRTLPASAIVGAIKKITFCGTNFRKFSG